MSNESRGTQDRSLFDLQGLAGTNKHIGGFQATEELLAMCHFQEAQRVLGVGWRSCWLRCSSSQKDMMSRPFWHDIPSAGVLDRATCRAAAPTARAKDLWVGCQYSGYGR